MDVGIIVGEATDNTWDRWRHLSGLIERLGYHSLFRSDHYFIHRQHHAVDVFLSFVLTAEVTERIRFGPLVTPVTFRQPVNVGRMAQQLDALSAGRFVLGLGAGWHADEHETYGLDFPPRSERYDRLSEAIALMKELWYSSNGTFDGAHYRLAGTDLKPHPPAGRPPILIGGTGPRRTLRIAAETDAEAWTSALRTGGGEGAKPDPIHPYRGLRGMAHPFKTLALWAQGQGFHLSRKSALYDVQGGAAISLDEHLRFTASYRLSGMDLGFDGDIEKADVEPSIQGAFVGFMFDF